MSCRPHCTTTWSQSNTRHQDQIHKQHHRCCSKINKRVGAYPVQHQVQHLPTHHLPLHTCLGKPVRQLILQTPAQRAPNSTGISFQNQACFRWTGMELVVGWLCSEITKSVASTVSLTVRTCFQSLPQGNNFARTQKMGRLCATFCCLDFSDVAAWCLGHWPTELHLKTHGTQIIFLKNIQVMLYYYMKHFINCTTEKSPKPSGNSRKLLAELSLDTTKMPTADF